MKIFLAGENGKKRIIRKIVNETIFSGGESRHWLNLPLIEDNKNATIFGGRNNGQKSLERRQISPPDGGDMGSLNENILGGRSSVEGGAR